MNNNQLSIDKQNEFAMKANMILEIENTLLIFIDDPKNSLDQKQNDYKVQFLFNAKELEKYAKALNPYQENEKVRAFFEKYTIIKERIDETLKRIKNKKLEKEVKKLKDKIEIQAQELEIKKMIGELTEQYGIEEKDLKILNVGKKQKSKLAIIIELLIIFTSTVLILFGLSGIIPWSKEKNIVNIIFFALYFSGCEILSRIVLTFGFKKLIIQTFGLIMIFPSLIAIVISAIFPIFVEINSIFLLIITTILTVLIRKFMLSYVSEKLVKNKFKK